MVDHKNIYEAIHAVMQEVGYVQKERKPGLNYTYAGEAALIAALRPVMVEHGIIMYVKNVARKDSGSYTTAKGSVMISTSLNLVVVFHHVGSGTEIKVEAAGEGADTGDKSSNKAMTGAYKYALRQTFLIETGDDPDQFSSDEQARSAKKVEEQPKERVWSFEQSDAVLEHTAGITSDYEGANEILAASILKDDVTSKTVDSWMKHWRKNYDEAIASGKDDTAAKLVAADAANNAYKQAQKKGAK